MKGKYMRRLLPGSVAAILLFAQPPQPACNRCSATYIAAGELRAYPMPDFSHWKEKRAFDEGLGRLLRELTLADPVRKARAAQELRKP